MTQSALPVAAAALLAGVAVGAVTPRQAEQFNRKLQIVIHHAEAQPPQARRTEFVVDELNAYLKYTLAPQIPTGVTEPVVALVGQGRVTGRAIVDLDVIRRKESSGSWFDPKSYLTGRLPVTATGTLRTGEGQGRFELETADVSGIPIPKSLLQEIVSYYSRSADQPEGVSLDRPFALPAQILRIDVEPGRAIVFQ